MSNKLFIAIFAFVLFFSSSAAAQTSAFVFQGKLTDGAVAANGTYQFTFTMYDAPSGGNQIGQTLADLPATVTNGIFAVNLDFGANSFDGAARYIEVGVRLGGSGQNYTILSPRQSVASTPYAVKSLKSEQANAALTADNSLNLGGVAASQYVVTTDSRMSDDRNPLPDSPNYIQNTTSPQPLSNFNISGEGKANVFSANTQFNLGGFRVFHLNGNYNTFVGFETGNALAGGAFNAVFGTSAGRAMTTGANNSFFGSLAGRNNQTGNDNSFFGQAAGLQNTTGAGNSFFGYGAGVDNTTGANNTFVGFLTGQTNANGNENTFIGYKANAAAGITNATAIGANAFAAQSNTMVLGTDIVTVKVPGNFAVAQTFSANALDSATVYKINGNRVFHLSGTDNTFVGFESGNAISTGGFNAFFGSYAGKATTTGLNNSFFGSYAGRGNTTGGNNAFFGANAGISSNASFNAFFGSSAGFSNATGANNSYFGFSAGAANSAGDNNSFFGSNAGKSVAEVSFNSFFGSFSGEKTTTGAGNTFIGTFAGRENTIGFNNTFIGYKAGQTPTTGNSNVVIGYNASVKNGVSNAIAIGANTSVLFSNTTVIGGDTVSFPGDLYANSLHGGSVNVGFITATGVSTSGNITSDGNITSGGTVEANVFNTSSSETSTFSALDVSGNLYGYRLQFGTGNVGGNTPLCMRVGSLSNRYDVIPCSSSIRYKDNVQDYRRGLELLNQLRPVSFNWKTDGTRDVGFIAEEVNKVEPLLNTFNGEGKIEGVRYAQITTVLVNSVKEQQSQIETLNDQIKEQQAQIEALKLLVCASNPAAAVCQPQK